MSSSASILSKIDSLERNLQELKVGLIFGKSFKQKQRRRYQEGDILREVRKTRQQLWNEKYAKIVSGIL